MQWKNTYCKKLLSIEWSHLKPHKLRALRRIDVDEIQIREPKRIQRVTKHINPTRPKRLVSFPSRNQLLNSEINRHIILNFPFYPFPVSALRSHKLQQLPQQRHRRRTVACWRVQSQSEGPLGFAQSVHAGIHDVLVGVQRMLRIAPRGVVVDLVLDDEAEGGDGARLARVGLEDPGRWLEIERLDLEEGLGIRGGDEWEGGGGGVVVELGAEDRVGILEIVEGILEKWEVRRFWEEEA